MFLSSSTRALFLCSSAFIRDVLIYILSFVRVKQWPNLEPPPSSGTLWSLWAWMTRRLLALPMLNTGWITSLLWLWRTSNRWESRWLILISFVCFVSLPMTYVAELSKNTVRIKSWSCYRFVGGLEAFLHHHRCEPLLWLLRQVAVHHAEGEEKDQIWQKVRWFRGFCVSCSVALSLQQYRENQGKQGPTVCNMIMSLLVSWSTVFR